MTSKSSCSWLRWAYGVHGKDGVESEPRKRVALRSTHRVPAIGVMIR